MKLYIPSKIMSLHQKMDVLDDNRNVLYRAHSRLVSVTDDTTLDDANGTQVAHIHAKFFSPFKSLYYIDMADGQSFTFSRKWLRLRNEITIKELDWHLDARNILDLDFQLTNGVGQVIARASRPLVSLRDTYELDIFDERQVAPIVALFVTMKHLVERQGSSVGNN